MPKKAPKNAFYYFMLDFKDQQQKKGINYANLAEVSKAADPEWRSLNPGVRAKYEQIAKNKKQERNIPDEKYTSTGIPLSTVEQHNREKQAAIEHEREDITQYIIMKALNKKDILDEMFYIMDVNYYCKTDTDYVIGESTILRFNLRKGFRDLYHEEVNPGSIPFGYASDVKYGCQEYGLKMPLDSDKKSNYMQILAQMIDYMKQPDKKDLPMLFTMPDKVAPVQDFILQLCKKANEDEFLFRVYRLDTLFYTLINAISSGKNEGFPKETLALMQLKKDLFRYTPGLGCEEHEKIEKAVECTMSRTKRWAYTILDSCCPVVGIDVEPGLHVPSGFDIEGILTYKDQKKERPGPSVAGLMAASSSCNTTLNDSFRDTSMASQPSQVSQASQSSQASQVNQGPSSAVSENKPRKDKRAYAPMRMPQTDYSREIRPAPELTEDNFPTLSSGTGRGRGLAGNFKRMGLGK